MKNDDVIIDGTKMVAKDIVNILNEYPMCDVEVDGKSISILNHIGYVIKQIKLG